MDDHIELENLILRILIANESPLSSKEISDNIISNNLFLFHDKSPVNESELADYIDDYLSGMSQNTPAYCSETSDGNFIYTPYEDLPAICAVSLHKVYFRQYKNISEIMENIPMSDKNLGAMLSLSLQYLDLIVKKMMF